MTLAIEPMITEGSYEVVWLDDDWTVMTEVAAGLPIMKIRFLLQRANLRSFPYKEEVSWGSFYGYLSRLSDYSMYAS